MQAIRKTVAPRDEEIRFSRDEIIVSKTDRRGRVTYVNDVFCRVSELSTDAVIGQPHSIIRHPDMPRAVFKLMWETIGAGKEIFAYVKNMSATGRYYWVIAHVTPSLDAAGTITGFHSNRRVPSARGIADILPLYDALLAEERRHDNPKTGLAASDGLLREKLAAVGRDYDAFIWNTGD